jgi:hypothetical protein
MGGNVVCTEPFKLQQQVRRLTKRYESKTIAVGKIWVFLKRLKQKRRKTKKIS